MSFSLGELKLLDLKVCIECIVFKIMMINETNIYDIRKYIRI